MGNKQNRVMPNDTENLINQPNIMIRHGIKYEGEFKNGKLISGTMYVNKTKLVGVFDGHTLIDGQVYFNDGDVIEYSDGEYNIITLNNKNIKGWNILKTRFWIGTFCPKIANNNTKFFVNNNINGKFISEMRLVDCDKLGITREETMKIVKNILLLTCTL